MPVGSGPLMEIVLPYWRPGRYEAGNFSRNIRSFWVGDRLGKRASFRKIASNRWEVEVPEGSREILIRYEYYASELNAGSTFLDERQLYVNPVNCLVYCPEFAEKEVRLDIELPPSYKVASAMKALNVLSIEGKVHHTYQLRNYDSLADHPFIASADIEHRVFQLNGIGFHLWIQGECRLNWDKVIGDFFIFSNEQLMMMGSYPHEDYHFLVQMLPYTFYHGVEHCNSTVIAIGPGHSIMKPALYNEFLGVCCHELFHVWNVKHIRPADMLPYDFSGPDFSRLGYVYEGVTTYYGDLLLLRSGVFNWKEWVQTFSEQLQKHFDNGGRFNYSVADSSFDTWVDGYVPGVPDRKVSIYTEGCLLAFIADILIRVHSNEMHNLDHVMRSLWEDFGKQGRGYTAGDYRDLVEYYAGKDLGQLFNELIHGTHSFEPMLKFCLGQLGLELSITPSARPHETVLGFKATEGAEAVVTQIAKDSPAERAGLMVKDRIIGLNGFEVRANLNELAAQYIQEPMGLLIVRAGRILSLQMEAGSDLFFKTYSIEKDRLAREQERSRFQHWSGSKF